jgi:DNA-binding CsgD family transcriptional regulator
VPAVDEIIAREAELAAVRRALDHAAEGLTALVLDGEAGIGKSEVWQAAVAAARERSLRVLVSRPAETERTLPNVVLGDLLGDLSPELLAALPPPRRRAVEAALLLRDRAGSPVDPRTLGVAIVTLLPLLADRRPLVLAIDDDQWMDPSSAATLEFALRRLADQPLLLLLSRRLEVARVARLEELPDLRQVERIRIGPLSVGAIQLLLRQRLGVSVPRPMLLRIHEISGGNPFHALELARAQAIDPTRDTALPLAVSADLGSLVDARLQGLSGETRQALLITAAHGRLPFGLMESLHVTHDVLQGALDAALIHQSGDVISFTHPLLASAVYQGATADERRAAHRLLATAVSDPVLRAHHLALGADGPNDEIAAAVESAAGAARDRGIPIAAAELAEHALRLTPTGSAEDRHRRAIATARALFEAGEGARALALAAQLRTRSQVGRQRAETLMLSADLVESREAVAFLRDAYAEARANPELRAAIHAGLASAARGTRELAWAERHAEASLRLAEHLDDDGLRAAALAALAPLLFDRGDPQALGVAERAHELAVSLADQRELKGSALSVAHILVWSGLTDKAREWLEVQLSLWGDRDEDARSILLVYLAFVEIWAGRWSTAHEYAAEAQEISAQYGDEFAQQSFALALIELNRGQFTAARERARLGLRGMTGARLIPAYPAILGIAYLWNGNPGAALPHLAEAEHVSETRGLDEANNRWWRAEHVEALLQAGHVDAGERLLDEWDAAPTSVSRERVAAQITRCRGLLAAAQGKLSTAAELLEQAVEAHDAVGDPFGRARALFALGLVRRRALQKRSARTALEAALAGFEELGAASWAAATRTELGRIGGRQRIEGLSPSELSVAALVAEGRTNREIAAALFLGERTVASHLTHAYAKLGIRSRTELARHLRSVEPASVGSKVPTS